MYKALDRFDMGSGLFNSAESKDNTINEGSS